MRCPSFTLSKPQFSPLEKEADNPCLAALVLVLKEKECLWAGTVLLPNQDAQSSQ